ncbi:MAG: FRG domain-containing protein [bacterium]|nr:FRG domain-containing protein [bacterium]
MTNLQVLPADRISTAFQIAVDFLEQWATSDTRACWFRGINDGSLSLQPGACWRTGYSEWGPLVDLSQDGVSFKDVGTVDEWSTYYLAQHHRIPTRLLDWTESFAAALFFAFDGWDGKTTPGIWLLQPMELNEVFLRWHGILTPEHVRQLDAWLPRPIRLPHHVTQADEEGYVYDNRWPLAIYPRRANRRLIAQQGYFTVHGRDPRPLDELVDQCGADPASLLAKIELVGFDPQQALHELDLLGIRRSAVYPDIDNFVQQLQALYGW